MLLLLPGRVFFVKARQLKQVSSTAPHLPYPTLLYSTLPYSTLLMYQGATIQRVYRGNWQEDVLWRLRDILISKRMMEHHQLEAYIRALSRC